VLYLIGSFSGIFIALSHFPMFFLGFIIRGNAASIFGIGLTLLNLVVGIGILRRNYAAWVVAFAVQAIGILASVMLFLPRNRALFVAYQRELTQHLFGGTAFPLSTATNPMQSSSALYLASAGFGIVIAGAILWLLMRTRPLFRSAA
jgi:hypothetical protein